MRKLKRSAITTLALLGLLVSSGIALAETSGDEVVEEGETNTELMANTVFSFGYDLVNGLFLWNLSSIDEPCALPAGEESDPGSEPDPELDPVPDCELTGGEVAGPNGQINHGMFMKLFNSLFVGPGRGCVVRHLAQSDLGKGDQQVKGGDEVVESDSVATGVAAVIDFTTIETLCKHEFGVVDDEGLEKVGKGKPDWAGKPEGKGKPDSPGKSESAPGKNK